MAKQKPADKETKKPEKDTEKDKDTEGPLVGKVLRVVSESASRAAYGFQGKCLSHTLSTQKVLLELEKQRLSVQAEHCIEAEAFLKRSVFYKLNSVTRIQKAQMLESSGCLYGILEKPGDLREDYLA